jgi:hypothetical protein
MRDDARPAREGFLGRAILDQITTTISSAAVQRQHGAHSSSVRPVAPLR